ncbi:MAG TPA: Hsp20/alpha crystallin family protein [Desulfuromonadaceae bacterium]|jgi:HSP20 family protein
MKAGSHLKSVSNVDQRGTQPVTERSSETRRGSWYGATNVPSFVDNMERMMNEFFRRPFGYGVEPFRNMLSEYRGPAIDIYEEEGTIVVKADLPGLSRDDIEVKLYDNNLEISGEKVTEQKTDKSGYLRLERFSGRFNRIIPLPEGLDSEHVDASFNDGVLEIRIPRVGGKPTVQHIEIK